MVKQYDYDPATYFKVEGFQRNKILAEIGDKELAQSAKDHFEKAFESFNVYCKDNEKFEFWIEEDQNFTLMFRAYSNQISKMASSIWSAWQDWLNEVDPKREIFGSGY